MEHLPTWAGSEAGRLRIPYLGGEKFEARMSGYGQDAIYDFKIYWDRRGFQRQQLTGALSFQNLSPREIAQSLQSWFYFGNLICIFRILGIRLRTQDFVDPSPLRRMLGEKAFVSSALLPGLIARWTQLEGFSNGPSVPDVNNPRYRRGENIKEMLNWTFYYMDMFNRESQTMSEADRNTIQLVELSIMAMAESLCSVIVAVYGYDIGTMPSWGPSPVLTAQLRSNGWCISDSPFFPESMRRAAVAADYYFGSSPCPRPGRAGGDHSKCTTAICNEYCNNIVSRQYQQTHAEAGCECEAIQVPKRAIRLVGQGEIPVLRWDGETLEVSAGDRALNEYVAISHVWSDGLGNDDKSNSLWACQLTRLQILVSELAASVSESSPHRAPEGGLVPFWIDTLCVPVGDENRHPGGDTTRDLRKDAVGQMAAVYRGASQVLVLDSFILALPRSADVVEKYLQVHLSNWHHRLWTMQEGQLARRLFFQFRDGAESFDDMKRAELRAWDYRDPRNLCSPVRLLCAVELESFYRASELSDGRKSDITARMRSCARYLRSRETSRSEDESVCVATILGLAPREILEQKGAAARMARFYDLVGRFDPYIIFHDHPRLAVDGYRWAPASFLRQVPDLIGLPADLSESRPSQAFIRPNGGGLPVRFGGFEFTMDHMPQPGSPLLIRPITDGRGWGPRYPGDYKTPWFACTFKMELRDVLGDAPPARRGQRWAVIWYGCLERTFLPDLSAAVVGVIDADTPPRPATPWEIRQTVWTEGTGAYQYQYPAYAAPHEIAVRYVCRARIIMPAPETVSPWDPALGVWAYGGQQEWCLR